MEEMESMQWQKIATEDLKQGGSLRVERKSPVFLAGKVSHHNFFFILTYKQLWSISILTLSIYYVSAQWASRGAPGKSGLHASGEGERVIAPEPW